LETLQWLQLQAKEGHLEREREIFSRNVICNFQGWSAVIFHESAFPGFCAVIRTSEINPQSQPQPQNSVQIFFFSVWGSSRSDCRTEILVRKFIQLRIVKQLPNFRTD